MIKSHLCMLTQTNAIAMNLNRSRQRRQRTEFEPEELCRLTRRRGIAVRQDVRHAQHIRPAAGQPELGLERGLAEPADVHIGDYVLDLQGLKHIYALVGTARTNHVVTRTSNMDISRRRNTVGRGISLKSRD